VRRGWAGLAVTEQIDVDVVDGQCDVTVMWCCTGPHTH